MFKPRCLILFTKPARPGRVKTRLIGALTPEDAARLHRAFVEDLLERLTGGAFDLRIAWDLDPEDEVPPSPSPGVRCVRQEGGDLGERLHRALSDAGHHYATVAALGSDHPHLPLASILDGFERIEAGADVALGPADDGGYYLVALAGARVPERLFAAIPWSTERVLSETLARCEEEGLRVELLPTGWDVDRPEDLDRLAAELARGDRGCPRTQALLASWGRTAGGAAPAAEPR